MSRLVYGGLCLLVCIAALVAGCAQQYSTAMLSKPPQNDQSAP